MIVKSLKVTRFEEEAIKGFFVESIEEKTKVADKLENTATFYVGHTNCEVKMFIFTILVDQLKDSNMTLNDIANNVFTNPVYFISYYDKYMEEMDPLMERLSHVFYDCTECEQREYCECFNHIDGKSFCENFNECHENCDMCGNIGFESQEIITDDFLVDTDYTYDTETDDNLGLEGT